MNKDETWAKFLDAETHSQIQTAERPAVDLRIPGLTILSHPDPRRIGEQITLTGLEAGREVFVSRLEPLFADSDSQHRRPLADPYLSRRPVHLLPKPRGLLLHDSTSKLKIDGRLVESEHNISTSDLEDGVVLLLAERVCLLLHLIFPSPPAHLPAFSMVGESPAMILLRRKIQQIANLPSPVLLRGETGTGKELVARAIHDASSRRGRAYLPVNMAAIPPNLAVAELFGAGKGAYTGADKRRQGYFERAHGGSLFLDEIGDIPTEVQVALLRVLETQEVQPVGERLARRFDVRVIAATDADLETRVANGVFRAPLLHRLSAYQVSLPPLRKRRDDIGRLMVHFLRQELELLQRPDLLAPCDLEQIPWLGAPLMARLASADWPGNVRQLHNVARQIAANDHQAPEARLNEEIELQISQNATEHTRAAASSAPETKPSPARRKFRRPEEITEEELVEVLRGNRWRLQPTAVQLNISRTALYGLIDRFQSVRKPRDLGREEIVRCYERCGGDLEAMVDVLHVSRKGLKRRMTEFGLP